MDRLQHRLVPPSISGGHRNNTRYCSYVASVRDRPKLIFINSAENETEAEFDILFRPKPKLKPKIHYAVGIASKIHVGVIDNAANMVAAMQIAAVFDIGCVAHTLQPVLHNALFMQTSVELVVKRARSLIKFMTLQ